MEDFQRKYLTEAGLRIQHEGFIVCEEKNEQLPIEWAGSPICNVNGNGGMSYDPEQIRKEGLDDALDRVREIVEDTLAYMRHMETAPPPAVGWAVGRLPASGGDHETDRRSGAAGDRSGK